MRMLHTMLRVGDLERSLRFYTEVLGMRLLRRKDYPEGTRTQPGKRGKYHLGGAWLAVNCGVPVVPVAHNAGLFWRRKAFLKRPGTVTVEIGAPIDSRAHTPESLNATVERWIEERMAALCPGP